MAKTTKNTIRQTSLRWHNRIGWWATAALLIWGLSAIAHPLMSWTGPKATRFFAPTPQALSSEQLQQVEKTLKQSHLQSVRVVKVVPSSSGAVLQVSTDQQQPRRYFDLSNGQELEGQDEAQARWLASHYTGRNPENIGSVEFLTDFDASYPWVNRLLPVYRVKFAGDDQLTAFIHTETAALASLSNNTKHQLQTVFRALHTFSWLDATGSGRVIIMTLFMFCLIAIAATGLGMVVLIRGRKIADGKCRWHRLSGYVLWLPLLGWSASGFYHLLQSAYAEPSTGMALGSAITVDELGTGLSSDALNPDTLRNIPAGTIQAASLVTGPGDKLFYRISIAPEISGSVNREQKYKGQSREADALYLDASSGELSNMTDEQHARYLATSMGVNPNNIARVSRVTHFGPGYDFRNKRLPVWQIDLQDDDKRRLFVDTTTGILVDQNRSVYRIEGWSFSLLHKWNHLVPVTGRFYRDVLIVITLALLLMAGGLGSWLLWQRQATERRRRIKNSVLQDA